MRPELAVAFVIREKFSWSLASLKRLYALAGTPFTLYFVDARYPAPVRAELEAFLAGKENVVRIEVPRFLYPSEALNLVVQHAEEPWLLQLQNDVLLSRGAAASMLETARALDCGLVTPLLLDTDEGRLAAHRHSADPVRLVEESGRLVFRDDPAPERRRGRLRMHYFEMHCFLMSRAAARAVTPLAPLSVHEHIDLVAALRAAGEEAYLDENARALFLDSPPVPLRDYEAAFYRFRWEPARARLSQEYVRDRWKLAELFDVLPFVARQQAALRPESLIAGYDSLFAADLWDEALAGS